MLYIGLRCVGDTEVAVTAELQEMSPFFTHMPIDEILGTGRPGIVICDHFDIEIFMMNCESTFRKFKLKS